MHLQLLCLSALLSSVVALSLSSPPSPAPPKVFVLTDISNEPDDAQSLVRLLVYSNEIEIKGLVACTSNWLNQTVRPNEIHSIVDAYEKVETNLQLHGTFPSAIYLRSIIAAGPATYGLDVLHEVASEGVNNLVRAILTETDVLWVHCWGGANALAHALYILESTLSVSDFSAVISRVRVYSISDQDNAGPYIRARYPSLFYIVSVHGWNQYGLATWVGISGEKHYKFDQGGPNSEVISASWIKQHIQIGSLGAVYPDVMFIMEGDSPAVLYLVPNGLGVSEMPQYGSWGGRYLPVEESNGVRLYTDTADLIRGEDGREYKSNQATIWRWRVAYQSDFAGRMQWTINASAPHAPVVIVNSTHSTSPLYISLCREDSDVIIDASASYANGSSLSFKLYQYCESTASRWTAKGQVPELGIDHVTASIFKITPPPWSDNRGKSVFTTLAKEYHLILEVSREEEYAMRTYRRIIMTRTDETCFVHDEL